MTFRLMLFIFSLPQAVVLNLVIIKRVNAMFSIGEITKIGYHSERAVFGKM